MTHFVGLVVCDDYDELERLLAPYDESHPCVPYFREIGSKENGLDWNEFEAMCKAYKTDDPKKLVKHMEEWAGAPGEIIDGKLGYYSTYNEGSKWDWYDIGGRWEHVVPGAECLAEEVKKHFTDFLPAVIVDRKGWHESKAFGWFGGSTPVKGKGNIVKQKLKEHKGKNVFIVDFHI